MSETKFMPAPWWVEKRSPGYWQVQCAHRGPGSSFCIAPVNQWADNAEATAHLIASAPDLYAAAETAIKIINTNLYHQREKVQDAVSILQAALSRARGETET